jgi:3-dehydroquinate synthase II
MKHFWVRADGAGDWDKRKKLITTALENGAEAVVVKKGETPKTKILGKISTASFGDETADIFITDKAETLAGIKTKKAYYKDIKSKADEKDVTAQGAKADYIVINASDWKIIPLENIIASLKGKTKIIVEVSSKEDAKTALETLEIGADGILLNAEMSEIKKTKELLDKISMEKLALAPVKVKKIKQVGMGDRVCIDTCSMFAVGEGMLVGSQSNSLFLVHSESIETQYVAARPFRVNAGPVHAYTRMPDGSTKYLSELSSGDEVLAVDWKGNTRPVVIGRLKIERRPLMLIEAELNGKMIKTILQNAETIRLVDKNGKAVSITALKEGDEVMAYVEDFGRHFGMKVAETITEK